MTEAKPTTLKDVLGREIDANDIRLIRTCEACPEQYDAYHKDMLCGYLRLRHGSFRVDFPNVDGVTIYNAEPEGDGEFMAYEREHYLFAAQKAIAAAIYKVPANIPEDVWKYTSPFGNRSDQPSEAESPPPQGVLDTTKAPELPKEWDVKPTNDDITAALKLSRKYIYDGYEPYTPAIMSFARMLAAHRIDITSRVDSEDFVNARFSRGELADLIASTHSMLDAIAKERIEHEDDNEVQLLAREQISRFEALQKKLLRLTAKQISFTQHTVISTKEKNDG